MKNFFLSSSEQNKHLLSLSTDSELTEVDSVEESDFVLILGGDGSLNYFINNFLDKAKDDTKVLYYPSGTANDFSKSLKLTENLVLNEKLILDIVFGAATVKVPIMRCNDRRFINVASFGIPAEVTDSEQNTMKDLTGKVSYYLNAFNKLFIDDSFDIEINGKGIQDIKGFLISQGLYVGGGIKATTSHTVNFGKKFNFLTTKAKGFLESVGSIIDVNRDELSEDSKIISQFYNTVKIMCNKEINVKLDGEKYKSKDFDIYKENKHLSFFIY